jgi:hypothetical protein
VQRPGAAEGQQREVARIMAALDRHDADRADHVVVGDREDAARGSAQVRPSFGDMASPRAPRAARSSVKRPSSSQFAADGRGRDARR